MEADVVGLSGSVLVRFVVVLRTWIAEQQPWPALAAVGIAVLETSSLR